MTPNDIINVSEADFGEEVLEYSQQIPVIVDFWAEWCSPCKALGPMLERLVSEARGTFRLAKVNVDEEPNLAVRYGVRSIPAVKAFRHGQVISEFAGAIPEPRLRQFLNTIAPNANELALEKGQSLLLDNKPHSAEITFRKVLESSPEDPTALLGLVKSLLLQGETSESRQILRSFPPSREYASAQLIYPLAEALHRATQPDPFSDEPLQAAYDRALRLVSRGNYPAAMDGMLDILRQDKHFRHDEVRKAMLGLLELLGDSSISRQYRSELASVLF